jgi:V/A-type H+-transporting ATPase subunit B
VILGEAALTENDKIFLKFADDFEREFVNQGINDNRTIEQTLDIGWKLMAQLPRIELKRLSQRNIDKYMPKLEQTG